MAEPTENRSEWTIEKPVDSLKEAVPLLRRPFTPHAVRWKVQAQFKGMSVALVVPYIDARLVVDRLNLVCPHLWAEGDPSRPELPAFENVDGGLMLCRLTVDGITRSDVGYSKGPTATAGKGLYSDALKRAAVKFGIGVSLYAIPKLTLSTKDGHVEKRRTASGESLVITPKGSTHLRSLYEDWLDKEGAQAFGKPLDHGDSPNAGGDLEIEEVFEETEGAAPEVSEEHEAGQQALSASIAGRAKPKAKEKS